MNNYKARELANGRTGVYEYTEDYEILVKTFKTRTSAEKWIAQHS